MAFYSTVTPLDKQDIENNMRYSHVVASSASIYRQNASDARLDHGITTQDQLIANPYGHLMSDEAINNGSQIGPTWSLYWGAGGAGSSICNVFEASALSGLRSVFKDDDSISSVSEYGLDYDKLKNINRNVFGGNGGSISGGGGGGVATTPVPFLIGEYWNTYRYQAQAGRLLPVSYLKAIRPPKMGMGYFGNVDRRATIRIMDREGICWYATANFVLQNVNKKAMENLSLMQTSEGTIPLFGEPQLRVFSVNGILLNAEDYDWAREWKMNWESYFSATTLLDNSARFYLLYGGWLLGGYLMEYTIAESAKSPFMDMIQFQVMVTDYEPLPDMTSLEYEKGSTILVDQWASKESFIAGQNIRSAGTVIANPLGQQELIVEEPEVEDG